VTSSKKEVCCVDDEDDWENKGDSDLDCFRPRTAFIGYGGCSWGQGVKSSEATRSICRSPVRSESPPPKGRSNAARVSRGSEFDVWNGLTVAQPKRNKSEHVTITIVIYNTCEGGVPTEEDVVAAIDDLEELYAACSVKGRLADATFDFMKEKLAVDDMVAVTTKLATQPPPFVPSSVDVANAFTFPSDSVPAS
jgi:hypothetical protein